MLIRIIAAFVLISGLVINASSVFAQSAPVSVSAPGQFDFYVLSLSWSPSYCEAVGDKRHDPQCARPFGFVVHGLWPQFEKGYPSDCGDAGMRLPQELINAQLDIFPAPGLVIHEWRKHGSCSGLDPAAYFAAARKAFAGIAIPPAYVKIDKPQFTDPATVAKDFISANKGLEATEIAVVCSKSRLEEIRICMSKDLKSFHPCAQVASEACRLDKAYMPATRAAN